LLPDDNGAETGQTGVMETPPAAIPADEALARLAVSRAAFAALRPRVEARQWPLAPDFGNGPEASWGPREVLAHTAEMLSFWYGEFARIIEAGRPASDGLPFGRMAEDAVRIALIDRDRRFTVVDLFERIDSGIARWERTVAAQAAANPAAGAAMGGHPLLGTMSADDLRDQMVVTHLEGHIRQLEAILADA
jgi:hypothetical protein